MGQVTKLIAKPGNKTATVSWPDLYVKFCFDVDNIRQMNFFYSNERCVRGRLSGIRPKHHILLKSIDSFSYVNVIFPCLS